MGLVLPEDKHVLGPAWMYGHSHQVHNRCTLELLCRGKAQHSPGARDVPGSCPGLTQGAQSYLDISLWPCGHSDCPAGTQDFCPAGWSARATGAAGCTNITQMELLSGKGWCDQGIQTWKYHMWVILIHMGMWEEELIIGILLFWITILGIPVMD